MPQIQAIVSRRFSWRLMIIGACIGIGSKMPEPITHLTTLSVKPVLTLAAHTFGFFQSTLSAFYDELQQRGS
jgi:hypothetical protein